MGITTLQALEITTRTDLRLRSYNIPTEIRHHWWWISSYSGSLLKSETPPVFVRQQVYPSRLISALAMCADPYRCKWASPLAAISGINQDQAILKMYRRLVWISNKRYLLSLTYSQISSPIFVTTQEAFSAISQIDDESSNRSERCLQRCLLAIKTSRSFREKGVLFIGSMVETREMHAWIIEDGEQPDHEDRSWINHRPLLAYTFA